MENGELNEWKIPYQQIEKTPLFLRFYYSNKDKILYSVLITSMFVILLYFSLQITFKTRKINLLRQFNYHFIQSRPRSILILNKNFKITDANDKFAQRFKVDKQSIINTSLENLENMSACPDISQKILNIVSKSNREMEEIFTIDGVSKRFLITVETVKTSKKRSFYIIEWSDISIITKSERLAAWGSLTQRLAHEIKNPLTTILLAIRQIQRKLPEDGNPNYEQINQYIETAGEEIERLRLSTNTFMTFTHSYNSNRVPLRLQEIIPKVCSTYDLSDEIHFRYKLPENVPDVVFDEQQLRQVLTQILENSIDAIGSRGDILLNLETIEEVNEVDGKIKSMVLLDIIDTGCGIKEDILEQVFEASFTTKETGSGFGLAITKYIIDQNGARIKIKSLLNLGTTVTILFPLES